MQPINHGPTIEIHAPAKLNLHLEILARRDDGFHEIETLMTPVTIFDTLSFSACSSGQIELTCRWAEGVSARQQTAVPTARDDASGQSSLWGDLPRGTENIVVRAVEKLRCHAGAQLGAKIQLVKRIPSAAGLGGASSDAAAALTAANQAWKLGWTRNRLAALSAELGSDIPFFFRGGSAVCRGRGERIDPMEVPRLYFVVARPPAGLSTPEVYRGCQVPEVACSLERIQCAARQGSAAAVGRALTNRLQSSAGRLSPWVDRLEREFARVDCLGHQMSGSGSSFFGICRNRRHARRVAAELRARDVGAVFCAVSNIAPRRRR